MSTVNEVRADLYTLSERLVLGDRRVVVSGARAVDMEYSITHALELLRDSQQNANSQLFELRLRVALHFAPIDAINYDRHNPVPRHRLIRSFIERVKGHQSPLIDSLARDVARVLDDWDAKRARVTGHLDRLLMQQNGRCANCGVCLSPTPRSIVGEQPEKPYFENPDELLLPEVDHVEPISGFGTNKASNLQVLCRLCNMGKGDGLGVDVRAEVEYAGVALADIPLGHRAKMLFDVLSRDRNYHVPSGSRSPSTELTVRRIHADGGYIRSNLTTFCAHFVSSISITDEDS